MYISATLARDDGIWEKKLIFSETREQMTLSIPAVCLTAAPGAKLQDLPTALQAFRSHVSGDQLQSASLLSSKLPTVSQTQCHILTFFPVGFVLH